MATSSFLLLMLSCMLLLGGCSDLSLEGKLCDSEGQCLRGYVCDPESNRCVRAVDGGEDADGDADDGDGGDLDDGDGGDLDDGDGGDLDDGDGGDEPITNLSPWLVSAWASGPSEIRLLFSEAMASEVLDPVSYCIEQHDDDPTSCTPLTGVTINAVSEIDPQTFLVQLSAPLQQATYTIKLSGLSDLEGTALSQPDYADFELADDLRVIAAHSESTTTVLAIFSRALQSGPDSDHSADCTSAVECALRYQLSGPSDLGPITSAVIRDQNRVLLTHTAAQIGGIYMLSAANDQNDDGFEDEPWGAIFSQSGESLGASPADRSGFLGAGAGPEDLDDGPLLADPFSDGTSFGYMFAHGGRIYLGPSNDGRGAIRMWPDGSQPELIDFRIEGDQVGTGTTSDNNSDTPYRSIGRVGCTNNSPNCGPDNENGRGLFSSGYAQGKEWLLMGGSKANGFLDYIYVTTDSDRTLDLQYVDLSLITGPATKTFSQFHIFGQRAYLGFPDEGGKRPYLLNLMTWPDPGMTGLDPAQNGNGQDPCIPETHDACFLAANHMPYIGVDGEPSNTQRVVGIDLITDFNNRLYLGNNGGLVRSTNAEPLDYANYPEHWTAIVPTAAEYAQYESHATDDDSAVLPGDKAWPGAVAYQGRLYLARNVDTSNNGRAAQLWRCDPSVQTTPPPASASDCDPDDWTLIAANSQGESDLTQFNLPDNTSISLLATNGDWLYIGFDNTSSGINLYRTASNDPRLASDFEGDQGCPADQSSCPGLGGSGFGDPDNTRTIVDHLSIGFGDRSYLYLMVSGQDGQMRVFRTWD